MAVAYECDKCNKLVKEAKHSIEIISRTIPEITISIMFRTSDAYEEDMDEYNIKKPMELCKECQIRVTMEALETMKENK